MPQPPRQSSAVILIVDNDPLTLTGLAAALHLNGHECHCARDSEAALKAARALTPDLIICDIDLGRENGLELCQLMKRETGCEATPLLMLSRKDRPDIAQQARRAGGSFYLRKPYDPEVLLALVDKALWMPHLVQAHMTFRDDDSTPVMRSASEIPS